MAETTDILIAGAGPAGLIAAAALATTAADITIVDPAPPVTAGDAAGADLRSTAFLQPAQSLFEQIGLWAALAPYAKPLRCLRIVDCTGDPPEYRDERSFVAEDGPGVLGWNFMNWRIRAALMDHLADLPNVRFQFGASVTGLLTRTAEARVTLSDGTRLTTKLAVAADGRHSALRDAAGIGVQTTRYGQKSLAFVATQEVPHDDVSTEIYHRGGPFTMVPLADIDGQPASAIVWMNEGPRSVALHGMDQAAFETEMNIRSAGLFGQLRLASPRGIFPIITQRASALAGERVAVIAEAAHVLPPIGAQGLNTSVNDIAALLQAVQGRDPGDMVALSAYEKARKGDIAMRARAIDLFNRVTRSGLPPLQGLRLAGLKAAHDIAPLRRRLTRAGMGPLAT